MKTHCQPNFRRRDKDAFTLAEFMVMSGIFMLVVRRRHGPHLYGLKMSTRIGIKAGATDDARQAVSLIIGDIRGAQSVFVGIRGCQWFYQCGGRGGASRERLADYPGNTTNLAATNLWIRYYYSPDPNGGDTNVLMRYTDDGSARLLTANYVTNSPSFFKKMIGYTTNSQPILFRQPYSIQVILSFISSL